MFSITTSIRTTVNNANGELRLDFASLFAARLFTSLKQKSGSTTGQRPNFLPRSQSFRTNTAVQKMMS